MSPGPVGHAHYAVRGTVPRQLLKDVAAATYHQVWWPQFDTFVYDLDKPPVWDPEHKSYVDPKTRQPLSTWGQAEAAVDPKGEPAHVVKMGSIDVRGIEGGTPDAERAIRYATKYITKDLTDQSLIQGDAMRQHHRRLYEQLSGRVGAGRRKAG